MIASFCVNCERGMYGLPFVFPQSMVFMCLIIVTRFRLFSFLNLIQIPSSRYADEDEIDYTPLASGFPGQVVHGFAALHEHQCYLQTGYHD
uniref:Uncharacterized protein n=1 Tax=Lactuca sativa TaxID=4236 RepID=A0A9R1V9N3_LACSA|nr:hypothetical protein LSAT_V11C600303400 [Lactuca sativa]